jgi:putative ABC transport system permease protein
MGIIGSFTLRNLRKNRARSIVSIIGIALSCALVTAIFTTVTSIQGAIVQRELELSGGWEVSFSGLSADAAADLASDKSVRSAAVGYELGCAALNDETGYSCLAVRSLPEKTAGSTDAFCTRGSGDTALATIPELKAGRLPEAEGEIALPEALVDALAYAPGVTCSTDAVELGSTVTLTLNANGDADADTYAATQSRSYTVVGIISSQGADNAGEICGASYSTVALVAAEDATEASAGTTAYALVETNLSSYSQISAWADGISESGATLHSDLLRDKGMTPDRVLHPFYSTLWAFAGILVAIVMIASVSLVYTSFAISVTERTRQLGLLSGIGASARQLRRSVIAEALMLGAVGIPVGIALGVGGTAITLVVAQPLFASIISATSFNLCVDWRVLLLAVAISLVTLLISASVPALRASRVSAVDTMRQTNTVRVRKHRGRIGGRVAQALFGVPGLVAHRNLTRSSSRSRVVVASLAVSVMLVVTCGCIDAYMDPVINVATGGNYPEGTAIVCGLYTTDTVADSLAFAGAYADFASEAASVEGVTAQTGCVHGNVTATIPESMVSDEARGFLSTADDGTASLCVYYIDDAEWRSYVSKLGLSEAQYCNSEVPLAIGVSTFLSSKDGRYVTLEKALSTGTVTLHSVNDDQANGSQNLEIGAVASEPPDCLTGGRAAASFPAVILPVSAVGSTAGATGKTSCLTADAAMLYVSADDDVAVAEELRAITAELSDAGQGIGAYVMNIAETARTSVNVAALIRLLAGLFSIITMLIALANVFNTLTNSIVLRTREFAMLRSIGMGDAAFRRMMLYECASYALRGLVFGLALALGVSWLMMRTMSSSFAGLALAMPLPYVLAAVAGTAVVLLASAVYALRRSNAQNVVEALRTDAL